MYHKNKIEVMEKSSQKPSLGQGLELASNINKAIASVIKKFDLTDEEIQAKIGKPGKIYKLVERIIMDGRGLEEGSPFLQLISSGEKLIIESLKGTTCISDAEDAFKLYIDPDFRKWKLDKFSSPTSEMMVEVSEIVKDVTLMQLFVSITPDLDKLVLTQSQIIRFCEKYPGWLREARYATFFLTRVSDEYFVVHVHADSGGLRIHVYRTGHSYLWRADDRHRVVLPRLMRLENN